MVIVNIEYTAPLEIIDKLIADHRAWLEIQYQKNLLLCSGPKNPRTGGTVIALSNDLSQVQELFQQDPYCLNKVANYTFSEFNPVKYHQSIKDLVA